MVMSPMRPGTKNKCAGKASSNLLDQLISRKPGATRGGVNESEAVKGQLIWIKPLGTEALGRVTVSEGCCKATSTWRSNRVERLGK
jgi:hypothetical protein